MPRPVRPMAAALLALPLLAGVGGCRGDGRPFPTPVLATPQAPWTPPSPVVPDLFRTCIVSGWDARPVTARLVVDGRSTQTDGAGCLSAEDGLRGRAIDIDAHGYLPRKTRIDGEALTLWPVANPAEAEAIRTMVFMKTDDGDRLLQLNLRPTLVLQMPDAARYLPAFAAAADEINEVLQDRRFAISQTFVGYAPLWPVYEDDRLECGQEQDFGFCLPYLYSREDEGGIIRARRDALASPATPMRIMAFLFLWNANPLRGLLNPATPDVTTLTDFERRLLRMLFQRKPCTVFPDTDRDVQC